MSDGRLFELTGIPTAAFAYTGESPQPDQRTDSPDREAKRQELREDLIAAGFYPHLKAVTIIEVPEVNAAELPEQNTDAPPPEAA